MAARIRCSVPNCDARVSSIKYVPKEELGQHGLFELNSEEILYADQTECIHGHQARIVYFKHKELVDVAIFYRPSLWTRAYSDRPF